MTDTKKCQYCDKRGLPILLIRDAIAQAGKGAPLANEAPIELEAAAAHYTKRLLRSGYVNVYDEARKRWELYFVTAQGHYFKLLLPRPGITAIVPEKPFNCPDKGHSELASCITVSDPKHATKVWIGFSDVLWTDAVRTANESAVYRKRHMVEVDVEAALAGTTQPHARPIAQLPAVVAEYAMNPRVAKVALGWGPYELSLRQGAAQSLINAFDGMRPRKGLMVTLPDPAGIAAELAALMTHCVEQFNNGPDYRRKLAADFQIGRIETAIRESAKTAESTAAEEIANERIASNPIGHLLFERERKETEGIREVTLAEAEKSAEQAWKKYANKLNNEERKKWQEEYKTRLQAYDKKYVAPLAENHVSWMKSKAMSSYFSCNYDPESPHSGVVYTAVVTQCVRDTQDKLSCSKLYEEWLEGDVNDKTNLALQALFLNIKKLKEAVGEATKVSIDPRMFPWDNILAIYTSALGRFEKDVSEVAARLVVQFAGPFSRVLGRVLDGTTKMRAAVISLGVIAGHPVIICEIEGSKKQFRQYLIKTMLKTSGQTVSKNQIQKAVADQLKQLQIQGVPIEGSTKKRWFILLDKEVLTSVQTGNNTVQKLSGSIRTVEQIDNLNLDRWRTVVNNNVRFGIVAGLIQTICLTKTIADEEKALSNEGFDATSRMYAGIGTVVATTADVLGNYLEKRAIQGLPFGQGLIKSLGTFISKTAGRAAIGLGLFVAVLDGRKAYESFKEEKVGLAILYGTSAAAGFTATLLIGGVFTLGAFTIPVIGILIFVIIGVAVWIEYLKDNPVQDWLERCVWGTMPAERYKDMETEQAQLAQALK